MPHKNNTLAVLGGSFNPVHFGHLAIAESARIELGYETVLFVPSSIPAHKSGDAQEAGCHRIAMIEIAVSGKEYISIETCEIDRGGVSYTIETIDYIKRHYAIHGSPGLIIGDDLIDGFHKWKHVDELTKKVDIVVAHRITGDKLNFDVEHTYLKNPIIKASSTDIRELLKNGKDVDAYLPQGVIKYIEEYGLYK